MKRLIRHINRLRLGIRTIKHQYVSPYDSNGYGKIGVNTTVKNNSVLTKHNMFLDDYVIIQDQTNFISNNGKLIVGKFSVISSGCTIVPSAHRLTVGVPFFLATTEHINDDEGDIIIEEDCWIGAGCILLPKCKIGRGAVVGAGSVVKKNIPPYAVVAGVPARLIATKFTINQIIEHEKILYPIEDRMTREELENLFATTYQGVRSVGFDKIEDAAVSLELMREKYGIKNYMLDS